MFYVNDIDGLKFQGPLEKLEAWRLVSRKLKINPLEEEEGTFNPQKAPPNGNAIAAYQKVISNNNMVEPIVHVYQIMSSPPKTTLPSTPLDSAWMMLQNLNIQQVIVTTEREKIIGILSERDILKHFNIIDNNIQLKYQKFESPKYSQLYDPFESNMSVIDLVFNEGANGLNFIKNS